MHSRMIKWVGLNQGVSEVSVTVWCRVVEGESCVVECVPLCGLVGQRLGVCG